jgi:hypothetical protein
MTVDAKTGQPLDCLLQDLDDDGWLYEQSEWIDLESGRRCLQLHLRRGIESEEMQILLEEIPD